MNGDDNRRREAWRYIALLWASAGALTLPIALVLDGTEGIRGLNRGVLAIGVVLPCVAAAVVIWWGGLRWPLLISASPYLGAVVTAVAIWAQGPDFDVGVLVYPWIAIFTAAFLDRAHHGPVLVAITLGYSLVVSLADGYPAPALRIAIAAGTIVVVGVVTRTLVERALRANAAEKAAREELAVANARLSDRVVEQDAEMKRLEGLRRFLSPQIADAVLNEGAATLLEPHRREIAVFFTDIRGFTAFAADAEPEEVIDLLGSFHRAIGELVRRYEATVGGFTGDGLFGYFNDPLPCPNAAERAVRTVVELREACEPLFDVWRRKGFALGVGSGVALGHATLGVIGFEGRRDYTALGTVVNLAARLCDEAGPGEVLVDPRAAVAVDGLIVGSDAVPMELKGIPRPVQPVAVTALRDLS